MLSKQNIQKELGKGINIVPFHESNFKENSVNLTIGGNAWTLGEGDYYIDDEKKIRLFSSHTALPPKSQKRHLKHGDSAIVKAGRDISLVLLPHQTTIVETREVIGVDNRIGGTLHSKVGVVAKGIGHIGTMLGPCYCGHLMISLHNITDDLVTLPVGSTFISLAFHYLDTPVKIKQNSNVSGHVDKLASLGVNVDSETIEFLTKEWKCSIDGVREHMEDDKGYLAFKEKQKHLKRSELKKWLNFRNIATILGLAIALVGLAFLAYHFDLKNDSTKWEDRYWTVLSSAIFIPIIMGAVKSLHKTQ